MAKSSKKSTTRKKTAAKKKTPKSAKKAVKRTAARKSPKKTTQAKRPKAATRTKKATTRKKTVKKGVKKSTRPATTSARPSANGSNKRPPRNQAGLSAREVNHFRDLLLAKRRELLGDMSSMEQEALQRFGTGNLSNLPLHMADMGTDNYEQEFTLGLMEKDRELLREINHSLAKMQDGSYGICEGTGQPISKARLEAKPWAKYSIEYARQMEKGMIRR